jgi:hypothetical protein
MTAALTRNEQWLLRDALCRRRDDAARQRAITERNLAEGCSDTDVLNRLARHEELELATLDSLATKLLPPEWVR